MRKCTRCLQDRSLSEFNSRGNGKLHEWCKLCIKEYDKLRYQKNKKYRMAKNKTYHRSICQQVVEWLRDKKCLLCHETDIVVLEFDHRDSKTKKFDIATGIHRGYSWKTLFTEIEKCDILCANCHRRKTSKQLGWFKSITG